MIGTTGARCFLPAARCAAAFAVLLGCGGSAIAAERATLSESLAACDRRAAAWEAFGAGAKGVDWKSASWPAKSRALMHELYRGSESEVGDCPTPARPWTDGTFSLLTLSFKLHQPPRVAGYGERIAGLVREVIANIRHQQQLLRDGKALPPQKAPREDGEAPAASPGKTSDAGIAAAPGLRGLRLLPLTILYQSVPPHCIPKRLPDVPDCGDLQDEAERWWACFVDNMNDVAENEDWEEGYSDALKKELLETAYDAAGLALPPGAAGLAHAGAGLIHGGVTGAGGIEMGLNAGGVGAATMEAAEGAGKSLGGAVIGALQMQNHAMMLLLAGTGRAQSRWKGRFARIRAGKCHTEWLKASLAYSDCLMHRESAQMKRDLVELENAAIAWDPSCNPPPPPPRTPDPEEEKRKKKQKEEWERRKKEIADRMARQNLRETPTPKPTATLPPPGHDGPREPGQPASFFDIFFEMTVDDIRALPPSTRPGEDVKPAEKVEVGGGLRVVTFGTLSGRVFVNLPDDAAPGDKITGTTAIDPAGETEPERARNEEVLRKLVVEMGGGRKAVGDRIFTWELPPSAGGALPPLVLTDPSGRPLCKTTLPDAPAGESTPRDTTLSPDDFKLPSLGQQGGPAEIAGPFDGDGTATKVQVGGKEARVRAESPRKCVFESPATLDGPTDLLLEERGVAVRGPYRNVGIRLSSPRMNLLRGERTTLTVDVFGLEGMKSEVPLQLDMSGVASMKGGNFQNVRILPEHVKPGGRFTLARDLTGVSPGLFSCTATVIVVPFDLSVQDDAGANALRWNSFTGNYQFSPAGGPSLTGTGRVAMKGCVITLEHNAPDRRIMSRIDTCQKTGDASFQLGSAQAPTTIADPNIADNAAGRP